MHVEKLYTLTGAAREMGMARQTVQRAVRVKRIPSYRTADGFPLVKLADLQHYLDHPLPPGRPRKDGKRPRKR